MGVGIRSEKRTKAGDQERDERASLSDPDGQAEHSKDPPAHHPTDTDTASRYPTLLMGGLFGCASSVCQSRGEGQRGSRQMVF